MSKNLALRERLFDLCSENLSIHFPQLQDVFLCPLCLNPFDRDAIFATEDGQDPVLTVEHIMPDALGGRISTLTCKPCNNLVGGSHLDSHLIRRLKVEDTDLSTTPLRVEAHIRGYSVEVELRAGSRQIELHSLSNAPGRNPHVVELIRVLNEVETETGRVNISPRIESSRDGVRSAEDQLAFVLNKRSAYDPLRSKIGILKTGYLLMFHLFGYEYILHENLQQVRTQILNPREDVIASRAILRLEQPPPHPGGVGLLYTPRVLRCFFVTLDLSTERDRYYGVVLPGLDEESRSVYGRWEVTGRIDFRVIPIPFALEFREYAFPTWIWHNVGEG